MADIPADIMAVAEDVAGRVFNAMHDDDGRLTDSDPSEIVARAILAERERAAGWHDTQADALEAAIESIRQSGGWVDSVRRSNAELHRRCAAAIRKGGV